MSTDKISILVVGAGAVGGITAALLKKAGHDVTAAVRNESHASLISDKGISIRGACGNHTVKLPAFASPEKISGKKDLILLAVKNTELESTAPIYFPLLKDSGFFVTMQNGICEEKLASVAGADKIIGCVTGWGATMENHGSLIMTSPGDFVIGYPGQEPDEFLNKTAAILSAVVPVRITGNIYGHKYSKLIINSCITSLGAVCGLYLGEMLRRRKIRNIFIEIIREAITVADKTGINVEIFGGSLDFRKFIAGNNFLSDLRRHLLIMLIGLKYRKLKSSSLQSLERGQRTEIDSLNGYIAGKAISAGVDAPVNNAIVKIIHEIERGSRQVSIDNFNDPAFRLND